MGLELYSKIEELFLDKEAAHILWSKFLEVLKNRHIKEVLDIGCGGGDFCLMAKNFDIEVFGIDLSKSQVNKAIKKGCNCEAIDICNLNKKFDSAVAIFDVINYMDEKSLKRFFSCVENAINNYFIFDINTLYAMEDLAVGTLKAEDEKHFAVLYSDFEDNKLITEITIFKKENECYKKTQRNIIQYYHSLSSIEKLTLLKLEEIIPLSIYGSEEAEKLILIMKKV